MKKVILILVISFFISCSSNNNDDVIVNPFLNTSWTADDPISSLLNGKGSTETIEFISETECQIIDYKAQGFFQGTTLTKGTYTYTENTVTWKVENKETTGTLSGSVLISSFTYLGNPMIYKKN